ncbi:hypothetical protein PPL_02092 [Heterostelium album PN500]|uniref:Armadillo repeat-containing protein n=1 Tax=Heterostelium pallidum (strain ATCC 26659 / Pp 5 / PN500) TaxID=670386 RepID=D3B1C1_HETP5|nr:hypothetical protein PPL_02092 [Heterostelium album PN500]EFA85095.1 hypothetical protein PPL_02092 [Heterostelium album PN500]|eukprot:XP_020437204.1 hypothetical protein PPL_02092 [Heterostelium album PN500]
MMNNIRLLQDYEIENYGSTKGINELLDEVRNVVDIYFNNPISHDNNNNNNNSNNNKISPRQPVFKSPPSTSDFQKQSSFGQQSPLKVSTRFQLNPVQQQQPPSPTKSPHAYQYQQQQQPTSPTKTPPQLSPNSTRHQQQQQQQAHNYSLANQKKSDAASSSFIDVRTIGLKELTTLLNRRREGSIHIRAIKQIATLYQNAKQSQSIKSRFIDEILQGSCLRSLLSFLTLQEPLSCESFDYSDPKISETIIDNSLSLKILIHQIQLHSDIGPNEITTESISIKLLDLLYQVSDCPKTRAFACDSGIEKLVDLLKVNEIYPQSLNRGNYYIISNTSKEDPTANRATLQIKVLQCLEKLSNNENNRSKIGMAGIYNSLSYLKPMYNIPPDVFRWNTTILEKVLKFIIQLLYNDHVKQVFVEKNGCNIIVSMVSSEYLPSTVLLSCAQVLGQIVTPKKTENSRVFYSVDKVMGNEIVPSLMKLLKSYPEERALQLLVCKVFTNLGTRDENKQSIFQEGGIQLLHNLLLTNDADVIAASCETIAVLSNNKFIRKVLRLLNSVDILIEQLNGSNQLIKKSCIQTLYNISCDEEGLEILLDDRSGLLPQTLISLLFSNDAQIQIYTIKLLSILTQDEQYLDIFINKGGIQAVLNSLYSNNENLQYSVLEFLNKVIQSSRIVQASILNDGIIDKLKKLSTHENVTRHSSILVQPLKAFLMTVKNLQPNTPPESPPIEHHRSHSNQQSRSNGNNNNNNSNNNSNQSRVGNSNSQYPAQRSPPQARLNSPPSPSEQPKQPDYKKIEAVLGKLDVDQLRNVILEMVRHDPTISEILPTSIKGVITGQPQVYNNNNNNNNFGNGGVVNRQTSSPPPPVQLSYRQQQQQQQQQQQYNPSTPPPPPLPQYQQQQQQPSKQLNKSPTSQPRTGGNNQNRKSTGNTKTTAYDCLMDEIRDKVGTGKLRLRHIDTEVETENRRKEELMQKQNGILKDIVNNAQKRQVAVSNKRVLVDSGTMTGMRIWKKDFDLWKTEIQAMFRRNINLTILIFRILESFDMDFTFKEAMEISQYPSEELLSHALIRIGFNIKQSTYTQDNETKVEYQSISKPTGMPFKLLLATILDYMK